MKKNITILGILVSILLVANTTKAFAYTEDIDITLYFQNVFTTTVNVMDNGFMYPALYTESSQYASEFSMQTSDGQTPYYNANVGSTFTVSQLGTITQNILFVHQRNTSSWTFSNHYVGKLFY